jgi:sugar phosphate isomerase/epimerase
MPGDGVIDVPGLRRQVEKAGYTGLIEFEILSRDWWARDPDEVLGRCKESHAFHC